MHFQITVRHGGKYQRYHTFSVDAPDAREALRLAAEQIPDEIAPHANLVELRVAVDPEKRTYLDEG